MNYVAQFGRVVAVGVCLCGILLAAGCSEGKGEVSGKVLYQGKPVRGGTVSFVSDGKGGVMTSPMEEDGSYTIRNFPPGTVKITVETYSARPPSLQFGRGGGPPEFMKKHMLEQDPEMANPQRAKRYAPIPQEYSDPNKSNLSYEVKSGKQVHDIELK